MNQWLVDKAFISLFYVFRLFRIKPNKIVISSYLGRGYGDNPKYIVEELLKRNDRLDIVWLTKDMKNLFPAGVRGVNYRSIRAIFEMCTAKIWIDNRRKPPYVRKRKGQCYIMTWHGYMAIKKVEKDAESSLQKRYLEMAKNDSKMIDFFVSGSEWETKVIKESFWYDGEILECGYPRSDILLNDNRAAKEKIRNRYHLGLDDRIVLYAPTFRQAADEESLGVYKLDWDSVLKALHLKFGGTWTGMIRLHPNVASLTDKLELPDGVINVTNYDDMQELIASSDCVITDYSSSIMDAGVARKIGLIFALDYADYQKDRDVYFDIKRDLPFPFAESNVQLIENINRIDYTKYLENLNTFLNDKYGIFDNGHASIQICELIHDIVNGDKFN